VKIRRHYLTLRRAFAQYDEHEPIEVTTEQLAEKLDCTHRNMVLLLKRMQQEQWLTWSARRGRGNRSTLIFIAPLHTMVLLEAQQFVQKQNLQAALELLQQSDNLPKVRGQFQEWLSSQFGFHSELQGTRRMDVLRFPLPQRIHSLDPVSILYTGESHLANQLFDGLIRMNDKGDAILPHIAHAWESDSSRTVWTFYLRKGVLFHNGRELVAEDVRYSLERLQQLAPQGLYSSIYNDIQHIKAVKETTVQIKLARRNELFLPFLTTNRASIVPQEACDGPSFSSKPIGTGPFRLAGNEGGVWILEAFAPYFQGRGFLDRVEIWTLEKGGDSDAKGADAIKKDTSLSLPELHTFQVMHNMRISDMAAEEWQQVRQSGMTCKFITVNEMKHGPLKSAAVRASLNAAIDRIALIEQLSGDVIEPAYSFWPEADDDRTNRYTEANSNVVSATASPIMTAAPLREPLVLATIPQYRDDAELVKQHCERAGFSIAIRLLTAEQFQSAERMSADLLLFAVMLDEHRELRLLELLRSMQQHMTPKLHNEIEQQISKLLTESSSEQRKQHFLGIEALLNEQNILLFLYRKHLKTAFHPSIRGISLESLGWVRFRDIWHT